MSSAPGPAPGSHVPTPRAGSLVAGKYLVEALLGRGGMGAVFQARNSLTGRRVALKWLLTDDPAMRARFLREAKAMGFLEHPNVVSVLDVGEHEGAVFLVMELLRGRSLRDHLGGRKTTVEGAIALLLPAMAGVAALHKAGIIHRDLKPDNVFVCLDGDGNLITTKLLDLGVARYRGPRPDLRDDLTVSGAVVGTPRYMAPEQLMAAKDLDVRADVFALGLILYELLTGRLPFEESTYEALVIDLATKDPPSPKVFRSDLPEELCAVVVRALAREREARFEDVESLALALEPFAEGMRFEPPRDDHVRGSLLHSDPPPAEASGDPHGVTVEARPPTRTLGADSQQSRAADDAPTFAVASARDPSPSHPAATVVSGSGSGFVGAARLRAGAIVLAVAAVAVYVGRPRDTGIGASPVAPGAAAGGAMPPADETPAPTRDALADAATPPSPHGARSLSSSRPSAGQVDAGVPDGQPVAAVGPDAGVPVAATGSRGRPIRRAAADSTSAQPQPAVGGRPRRTLRADEF